MGFAEAKARSRDRAAATESRVTSLIKAGGLARGDIGALIAGGGGFGGSASLLAASHRQAGRAREAYQYVTGWISAATTVIARRLSAQSWRAGRYKPPEGGTRRSGRLTSKGYDRTLIPNAIHAKAAYVGADVEPEPEHPVLWTLEKPNTLQGKVELLSFSVMNILLTGEWFWIGGIKDVKDDSDPDDDRQAGKLEIFAVPSSWMVPDHSKGMFSGYKLQVGLGGEGVLIPKENVARGYIPDPSNPTGCLPPLASCVTPAKIDQYILKSQIDGFARGMDPKIALVVGSQPGPDGQKGFRPRLTGAQRKQLIRAVRQVWSQTVNYGDPAILDGLIDDVKRLQTMPAEMDWQNSGKTVKDRIFQAFGVNPLVTGEVTPANKAQAIVAEQNFVSNVLNPLIENISCAASEFITPFYEHGDTLAVWLERAVPKDDELEFRQYSDGRRNGDISQDEWRGYVGLPPAEAKPPERSRLLDNPQVMMAIASLASQVNVGALSHGNAAAILMVTAQISQADADEMLPDDPPEPLPMPFGGPGLPPPGGPTAAPGTTPEDAEGTEIDDEEDDEEELAEGKHVAAIEIKHICRKSVQGKIARSLVKAAHKQQVARAENRMAKPLAKYIKRSCRETISKLFGKSWEPKPDSAESQAAKLIKQAFDLDHWNAELAKAAGQPVADAFIEGAVAEHELAKAVRRLNHKADEDAAKSTTITEFMDEAGEAYDVDDAIPEWMVEAADEFLTDAFQQLYWLDVNKTTRDQIERGLKNAIQDGRSIAEIRNAITQAYGDQYSRSRATAIARTETGAALNSGALFSIKQTYEGTGIEPTKIWQSVMGATTRPEHAEADSQEVPVDDEFTLGDEKCRFPGDYILSAANRVNCMCFLTSSVVGDALEDSGDAGDDVEERDFSPDQPRDDEGQWADGGGSSGGTDSGGSSSGSSGSSSDDSGQQESGAGERSAPREIKSKKEISEWASQHFPAGSKYPEEEIKGLNKYAGNGYSRLNNSLRTNKGELTEATRATVEQLDSALRRAKVPEDVMVFRGIKSQALAKKLEIGAEFHDHAFVSTSLHRSVAEKFSREGPGKRGAVLEIRVPKGTNAAAFDSIWNGGNLKEHELLLPRGSKFRVTGVRKTRDTGTSRGNMKIVSVELIPAASAETASAKDKGSKVDRDEPDDDGDRTDRFAWGEEDIEITKAGDDDEEDAQNA